MPTYIYIAKDGSGHSIHGKEFASNAQQLKAKLARNNLFIISMEEQKIARRLGLFQKKVNTETLVILCKQLATMLKGGVPLIRAVDSISSELKNPVLQEALSEMNHHIKGGESLSGSLSKFPNIFSTLFIAMVEAGEKSGSLEAMLERLSAYLQARDRLNKKIMAALVYPAFIIFFFLLAMAVFTLFLIPRFKGMYAGFGAQLPALTRIVFGISDVVIHNLFVFIIAMSIVVFCIYKYFFRTKKGRRIFDKFSLKVPLFGDFLKNASLSKFSRTLSALLGHGIPIAQAVELVGKTSGNLIIEEVSIKVKNIILDGGSIPEAMKKVDIFPPLMIQMISVGVESGSLPELLDKTADFYEDRVDGFVAVLTSMMEPVLIGVLGVAVGVMVVALYLPIFKLSQVVGGMH